MAALALRRPSPTFAVAIRGTVTKARSILADVLSVMIRGSGSLAVDSLRFSYRFAADPQAAVHLGFALAALILLHDPRDGILARIADTCPAGSDLLIAGHSQGAAVATLCRSYLDESEADASCWRQRTYLFAQPKPGNDHYAYDFDRLTGQPSSAWRFTNILDWVPQVLLTFDRPGSLNEPRPLALDLPMVWDFNFSGFGTAVVLEGAPGDNPADPHDAIWQHHAAMYYDLLRKTYPPS